MPIQLSVNMLCLLTRKMPKPFPISRHLPCKANSYKMDINKHGCFSTRIISYPSSLSLSISIPKTVRGVPNKKSIIKGIKVLLLFDRSGSRDNTTSAFIVHAWSNGGFRYALMAVRGALKSQKVAHCFFFFGYGTLDKSNFGFSKERWLIRHSSFATMTRGHSADFRGLFVTRTHSRNVIGFGWKPFVTALWFPVGLR